MSNKIIKICGITRIEDAQSAVNFGATALGFNFYSKSPRYIKPVDAKVIVRQIPANVLKVGIFVNQSRDEVETIARQTPLDILQFHGDETPKDLEGWNSWEVIKAFRIKNSTDIEKILNYNSVADYFLLDAFSEADFGGTGKQIPEELLVEIKAKRFQKPIIIAGGLTPRNIESVITNLNPHGVDVASGVEASPGIKDADKVRAFISLAKSAFSL